LHLSVRWRYVGQLIIGTATGLSFQGDILVAIGVNLPLMVTVSLLTLLLGAAISPILARFAGTDHVSAYFASLPGGVAEMAGLAERYGGDPAFVGVSQALRIFVTVSCVPTLTALLIGGGAATHMPSNTVESFAIMLLLPVGAAIGWLILRSGVPNAFLFGGILSGAAGANLVGGGLHIPFFATVAAQILVGCSLGARFRRDRLIHLKFAIPISIGLVLMLIAVIFALATYLSRLFDLPVLSLVLGMAPGGVAEMSLTANALHADIGFVTAFHLIRVALVAVLGAPLFLLVRRLAGGASRR
jgi:membrane AbrB-like protein